MMQEPILYEFKNIACTKEKNYVFQFVKNRKLTNIYHSHDFYELICFLNGNGTQIINGGEMLFSKNETVLLRPGDKHCFIDQSEDIEVISLSVTKEEFELFSNAFNPLLLSVINSDSMPAGFITSLSVNDAFCRKTLQKVTEYDCKLLLSYFLNSYINNTDRLKCNPQLPQMLTYANEEMKKKENLQRGIPAFVELSHYSHSHLARLVQKHFGMSLKRYINELRLQSAYRSIILTNESAETIAEELGFSSFSHFNKIFKERYSVTPASLRKSKGSWTA